MGGFDEFGMGDGHGLNGGHETTHQHVADARGPQWTGLRPQGWGVGSRHGFRYEHGVCMKTWGLTMGMGMDSENGQWEWECKRISAPRATRLTYPGPLHTSGMR